jgi:hypothetical protein
VSLRDDGLLQGCAAPADVSAGVRELLEGVLEGGRELVEAEVELLLRARGADYEAVCGAADELRRRVCGDTVTFVVGEGVCGGGGVGGSSLVPWVQQHHQTTPAELVVARPRLPSCLPEVDCFPLYQPPPPTTNTR